MGTVVFWGGYGEGWGINPRSPSLEFHLLLSSIISSTSILSNLRTGKLNNNSKPSKLGPNQHRSGPVTHRKHD